MSIVVFTGHLGQDPELRYTPSGSAVLTLSVADTSYWRDAATKEMKSRTEWHRVVIYGERAERLAEKAKKGFLFEVQGELRYRKYENAKGETVNVAEIFASRTRILNSHTNSSNKPAEAPQQQHAAEDDRVPLPAYEDAASFDDDIPF